MPEPKFTLERYVYAFDDPFDDALISVVLVEGDFDEEDHEVHAEEFQVESTEDMDRALAFADNLAAKNGGLSVVTAWTCVHCGEGLRGDYYMVTDEVWALAEVPMQSQLHLECLEERIGRPLTIADFTDCPVNRLIHFGHSLASRD